MRSLLLVTLTLCLAAGCDEDANPDGGGGSGGENAGGNGGDGGDGGDGGNGGNGECEPFEAPQQEPPVETITITITNESAAPVYLGLTQDTCDASPHFRATTLAGDPVQTHRGGCEATCSELASGGCECAADCAQPIVTMIHPGGSFQTSWVRRIYESTVMPEACYQDESCVQDTCIQQQEPSEALQFLVDGYPDVANCTEAICDCDGGFAGSCQVEGANLVAGTPVAASAQWNLADDAISITFE